MRKKLLTHRIQPEGAESRIKRWFGYFTVVTSGVGVLLAVVVAYRNAQFDEIRAQRDRVEAEMRIRQLQATIAEMRELEEKRHVATRSLEALQQRIAALDARVRTLPNAAESQPTAALRTEVVKAQTSLDTAMRRIGSLDGRMVKLEEVILDDPQKALALPLVSRDLAAVDSRVTREVEVLRKENERVYDLMKWLVGLMALVSLSLVGTAIGNVFKREPRDLPETRSSSGSLRGRAEASLDASDSLSPEPVVDKPATQATNQT